MGDTCWRRPATTRVPAGASTRSATWLAIVPDGRNSAASLPVSWAKRSWSRATVGSSPNPSSPTSAPAMASRMAGVGRVTVSLRRSTGGATGVVGGIASHGTVAPHERARLPPAPRPIPGPWWPWPRRPPSGRSTCCSRAAAALVAVETKSTHTDMVSEMDRASERLIVSTLLAARPDDGVVGEEGSEGGGHQRPALGDRPARRHHQLPVRPPRLGGVHRRRGRGGWWPAWWPTATHGSLFTATRGGAPASTAPHPGVRLHGPRCALVGTGFSYSAERRRGQAEVLAGLLPASATSAAWARRRWTCARWRAAGSTPTTSGGWRRGTSPPAGLVAAEAGAVLIRAGRGTGRPDSVLAAGAGIAARCVTSWLSGRTRCVVSHRECQSSPDRNVSVQYTDTNSRHPCTDDNRRRWFSRRVTPGHATGATPRSRPAGDRRAFTHRHHDRGHDRRPRRGALPRRGGGGASSMPRPLRSTRSRPASTSTCGRSTRSPTPAPGRWGAATWAPNFPEGCTTARAAGPGATPSWPPTPTTTPARSPGEPHRAGAGGARLRAGAHEAPS